MKLLRKVGVTSEIWQVFVRDSSSTTGAGLTGLTNASSGLTAYYHRDTDTTATAISLASMTVGTFTSSGFKEIDATNMPGWYQFCPPNAALASGAKSCAFHLKGATNMAPLPIEVDLQGDINLTHVAGSSTGVLGFERALRAIGYGTVAGSATTSSIPTSTFSVSLADSNQLVGRVILFPSDTSGTGMPLQASVISASTTGATPTLTVSPPLTEAPASGATFIIQ